MVTIQIQNVKSQIIGQLDKDTSAKLMSKLSYELPGAFFMSRYNPWAGVKYLFTRQNQSFPTGLVHYVRDILNERQVPYDIVDQRTPVTLGTPLPYFGPVLRDYQDEAVLRALESQRGILKIATGGGKSLTLTKVIADLNVSTLVLTHKVDLLYQLKKVIENALQIPIGIVGDGQCDIRQITVATIQTISRVYEKPKKKKKKEIDPDEPVILTKAEQIKELVSTVKCIITDECHHVPADSFWNVHKQAKEAFYKFGVSASPWRDDLQDLLIEAAHAKQLVDTPASTLIERGFLAQPLTYLYNFKHVKKSREGTYPEIYDEEVVNNLDRNKIIVSTALKAVSQQKTVLIAVTKIEHGKVLESMLQLVEPTAIFVSGEANTETRAQVLEELNAGTRKIVISTTIFGEGIDVPNLSVLINCKAGASSVDAFQLIGRVLRKTPTKSKAYVVDIFDQNCKYLSQHSKERLRIYQTEPKYILRAITSIEELTFDDGSW